MAQGLADESLPADINSISGTVSIAKGGTGEIAKLAAFNALAPTGVKGDVLVNDGTDWVKILVGADGSLFEADSGEALGVKWGTPNVFGQEFESAASNGTSTTTSTTFVNKLTFVTASLPLGDYRVGFMYEVNQTGTTNAVGVRVRLGGVSFAITEKEVKDTNDFIGVGGYDIHAAISGVQTIEIDFRQQRGGTAGIRRARAEIWRVA